MSPAAPHEYDELDAPPPWPLSRLYHENSKLTERRALELREQMGRFATDAEAQQQTAAAMHASGRSVALPRARRRLLGERLDDTLRARRSQRVPFAGPPLELEHLGALLELSVGLTGADTPGGSRRRAYPSAGGLYPVEVHIAALACTRLERAFYRYDVDHHALSHVAPCPEKGALERMIFADDVGGQAGVAMVLTGVFERTQAKYGERGYRFLLLEAGHVAQNLLLVAQSIGLHAVPIGGFCEDALGDAMGLDPTKESPLYVVLVGGGGK
jgi:SagB-type dehydrogenase family enzyme